MDGPNVEHSDSDSGESWSLVDHDPAYGDEVPEFPENIAAYDRHVADLHADKDEDTDGISIITDSDPELPIAFESSLINCADDSPDTLTAQYVNPPKIINNDNLNESVRSEDDFLGDNNGKHKTYVHRRNKRLSTVLNIIVLGSVITAAGVAIGHMWGAKNDCNINTTPSVNKILSNLYKLQEENAFLRSKLKELTLMNSFQFQQRKSSTEKQNKCKKVFEESLNKKADKPTKCVDSGDFSKMVHIDISDSAIGKEFLSDIDKLKQVYKQNKTWLDEEVSKRLKFEEQSRKIMKKLNLVKKDNKDSKQSKSDNFEIVLETISEQPNADLPEAPFKQNVSDIDQKSYPDRKISYADSLKSDQKEKNVHKRESNLLSDNKPKEHKRKNIKDLEMPGMNSFEEEFKKDDRYMGPKPKQERKKFDRQKLHKKQKRTNKYEQWEMKGGYLKDYDDFSITSQENEYFVQNANKNVYVKQLSETATKVDHDVNTKRKEKHSKGNRENDITWFEKRADLRKEARSKLEHELFGGTSPNNAGWYFRRMQRREQCRAKADNSTYKKLLKRNMNFKTKH